MAHGGLGTVKTEPRFLRKEAGLANTRRVMSKAYNITSDKEAIEKNPEVEFIFEQEEEYGQWVPNSFARNEKLSFECRGFLLYLFSHNPNPQKFKITLKSVVNHLSGLNRYRNKGIDFVRKLAREAEKEGYLEKQYFILKGLRRLRYIVHKKPFIKKMFTTQALAAPGQSLPLSSSNTYISYIKEEEVVCKKPNLGKVSQDKATKNKQPPSSADTTSILYDFKKGEIWLTKSDYTKLIDDLGEKEFIRTIGAMNDWSEATGCKYKNKKLLPKKIREWSERDSKVQLSREDKKAFLYNKELKEIEANKIKAETIKNKNLRIIELITKDKYWKEHIQIYDRYILLTHKGRVDYSLFDEDLGKVLKSLVQQKE